MKIVSKTYGDITYSMVDFTSYTKESVIRCDNKIRATQGCTVCWHCKVCGKSGCDNFNMNGFVDCTFGKDLDYTLKDITD